MDYLNTNFGSQYMNFKSAANNTHTLSFKNDHLVYTLQLDLTFGFLKIIKEIFYGTN